MASLQRGRGWHLLHHLHHPLFPRQRHHLHLLLLHHRHPHKPLLRQSKRSRCATAPPAVEAQEPNFMEDPPSASTPYVSAGGGPPSNASAAEVEPIGDEVAHTSPILITESPIPSPRQQAPTEEPAKEGGDEN